MANIPSSATYIQLEETQFRSAVSESAKQSVGGSVNYLLDTTTTHSGQISSINATLAAGIGNCSAYLANFSVSGSYSSELTEYDPGFPSPNGKQIYGMILTEFTISGTGMAIPLRIVPRLPLGYSGAEAQFESTLLRSYEDVGTTSPLVDPITQTWLYSNEPAYSYPKYNGPFANTLIQGSQQAWRLQYGAGTLAYVRLRIAGASNSRILFMQDSPGGGFMGINAIVLKGLMLYQP